MGNEQSVNSEPTQNGKISEKLENGSVNGLSATITPNGVDRNDKIEITIHQNGEPQSSKPLTESTDSVVVKSDAQSAASKVVSEIIDVASSITDTPSETTITSKEQVKKGKDEKGQRFGKLFKKKPHRSADGEKVQVKETETSSEDQVDVQLPTDPQKDTVNLTQESESVPEPKSADTADSGPEEETVPKLEDGNNQSVKSQEENNPEENPVMNFFKTLVTTKTPKKETDGPDDAKVLSTKEIQPAATTTVAQMSEQPAAAKGMPAPPPPPPEPPKMETKGEPATKPVKPAPKEEAKAAAKQTGASKGKSTKDTLNKFFRPKTIKESPQPDTEVEVQPVVEVKETPVEVPEPVVDVQKVDPSKAGTLEAAAKPEPPPAVQEEKKTDSKSSFMSFFKSKASEPTKTTQAPPAPTETAPAKEEPKVAAKSSEAAVENKPVSTVCKAGDESAGLPKKLEKRNSIQLFFKNLGQKRHSTDAGVQTEQMAVAPATEKSK